MRILIADPADIFRDGLKFMLSNMLHNIGFRDVGCIHEAIEHLIEDEFDLAFLSVGHHAPITDQMKARLAEACDRSRVIFMTDNEDHHQLKHVVETGGHGYVYKQSGGHLVQSVVNLILAGERYFPPALLDLLHGTHEEEEPEDDNPGFKDLSRRQIEVLREVSLGHSNRQIAENLGITPGTVKVHVSNLMRRLDAKNRTQLANLYRG
ncbi:response regulator transcription factor [Sneathiella chinensis]|uniref:XRE family transcriptional regulator n=1 Tax=Sneathiella chinensis TaxID=349750 RepID=A0ABQ5U6P8_9PROT|nr:response regulator transcription factor [Sneathiella chinensis]GLQ06939.1 XRE family transcriptional regulator [Sneathiella chinensis]